MGAMRRWGTVLGVIAALALVGCAPSVERSAEPSPSTPSTSTTTATPTPHAVDPIADLTLEQRVAQLFMVGTAVDSIDAVTASAVSEQQVGGVFLHGRSDAGVDATAALVSELTSLVADGNTPLWVATDQEGGDVQVLSGPGFDKMPTALTQARTFDAASLRGEAERWGSQLATAGVTMNLAPVADIVTSAEAGPLNRPIGALNREYGFDEQTVGAYAGAFAEGMRQSGVMPTFKHFPGLGRTTANTDYDADVLDTEVTATSPDVEVYRALLAEGPAVVMMSTAVYQNLDPTSPAAFSPAVVTDLLRDELGFNGVIMTDDLSATAQVKRWTPAERATLTIDAGVDVILISADPTVFPEMYSAVLAKAQADSAFAEKVDAAARRIILAKASLSASS